MTDRGLVASGRGLGIVHRPVGTIRETSGGSRRRLGRVPPGLGRVGHRVGKTDPDAGGVGRGLGMTDRGLVASGRGLGMTDRGLVASGRGLGIVHRPVGTVRETSGGSRHALGMVQRRLGRVRGPARAVRTVVGTGMGRVGASIPCRRLAHQYIDGLLAWSSCRDARSPFVRVGNVVICEYICRRAGQAVGYPGRARESVLRLLLPGFPHSFLIFRHHVITMLSTLGCFFYLLMSIYTVGKLWQSRVSIAHHRS